MYLKLNKFNQNIHPLYFTTREGGASQPPFDSLNLALHTGDVPQTVLANRKKLLEDLQIEMKAVKTVCQVHGAEIMVVDSASTNSWASPYSELPQADGLITAEAGVGLSVFLADCMAVYIFDPVNSIRTLLHAGWKSVHKQIIRAALTIMEENFGTKPSDYLAHISPGLRACCFEVQPDSFPLSQDEWEATSFFEIREGKHFFDLAGVIKQHLLKGGVQTQNIAETELCTVCDQRFFSYRREATTGRMAALWL